MTGIDKGLVARNWVHAHEEDSTYGPDAMVFRDSSVPLPPSRNRWQFQLRADQTMSDSPPGAADVPASRHRSWAINEKNQLVFSPASAGQAPTVMNVLDVSPDRLVVSKPLTGPT